MRIKLRDIAERANVSTATVSRVLNNNPNVDARTRAIVLQVMNQVGYPMMDGTAVGEGERTKSFTVIHTATRRASDFSAFVLDGIEAVAQRMGCQINLMRIAIENPKEEDLDQLQQASGVIIVGGAIEPRLIESLEKAEVPFVIAAAHLGKHEVNCVHGDYMRGAVELIEAMVEFGHRKIALVNGPVISTTSRDKLAGYKLGLCESGLSYDPDLVIAGDNFGPHAGQEATSQLLARTRDFSAIIYATDMIAMGGMTALKEAGIDIPGQVSVAGFYDEIISQFADPALTSVHVEWQRIGEIAATRLVTLLEQRDSERLRIVLPVQLMRRASLARAPQTEK